MDKREDPATAKRTPGLGSIFSRICRAPASRNKSALCRQYIDPRAAAAGGRPGQVRIPPPAVEPEGAALDAAIIPEEQPEETARRLGAFFGAMSGR